MKRSLVTTLIAIMLVCSLCLSVSAGLLGDINNDGTITAADARFVLRASAKLETLSEQQNEIADVNNDDKVTAADARLLLRVSAKLEVLESGKDCEHDYGLYAIDVEATCTSTGRSVMKCTKCGNGYYEIIPVIEHLWEEATCTNPKKCSLCGISDGNVTEHVLVDYECENCDYVDTYNKNLADYKEYEKIIKNQIAEIKDEGPIYYGSSWEYMDDLTELNDEIRAVKRKIAALSGDYSSSAVAKRKILEADLAELESELNELNEAKSRANSIDALEAELDYYYESLFG